MVVGVCPIATLLRCMKKSKRLGSAVQHRNAASGRSVSAIARWTLTAIIVPILGYFIHAYWARPQVAISVAKALVGTYRAVGANGVREYRTVVDLQVPCVAWLLEHSATSERVMPPPVQPLAPRMLYGVYISNTGRSELTDIRLTFRSEDGDVDIQASPQLPTTETQELDPAGRTLRTVTIGRMAPGAKGVLFGVRRLEQAFVRVAEGSDEQFAVDYSIGDADRASAVNRDVRFSGSAQLNDAALVAVPIDDLLRWQKEAFGLDALALPIDPVEFSGEGGDGNMRKIDAPANVCRTARRCDCYSVLFHQRGADSPEHVGHPDKRVL
jgi:hypothetical protein